MAMYHYWYYRYWRRCLPAFICVVALRGALDVNMGDLPFVFYAFVLHNYCEVHKETVRKQSINIVLQYDRDFQPPHSATNVRAGNSETEEKSETCADPVSQSKVQVYCFVFG